MLTLVPASKKEKEVLDEENELALPLVKEALEETEGMDQEIEQDKEETVKEEAEPATAEQDTT